MFCPDFLGTSREKHFFECDFLCFLSISHALSSNPSWMPHSRHLWPVRPVVQWGSYNGGHTPFGLHIASRPPLQQTLSMIRDQMDNVGWSRSNSEMISKKAWVKRTDWLGLGILCYSRYHHSMSILKFQCIFPYLPQSTNGSRFR